ncbi:DUF2283 domain-containing protein [Nostoc sp. TCL26-01]|uniref:DUF2283 domain-containing protein n=1 Tax=Nostoc sp. TCL26-01 TaxID=2576904 RepID=UPI0015BF6E54|nr:DUF2283 domain-containing protein [Nostoc sp. TCL26-01]QLE58967.1 DUF2283 domain-containing protein [Nostoc sp. TCL26-01]
MKISYDAEVDALSITFSETTVTTQHLAQGIAADYDAEGKLAGIEILDAVKRFGGQETLRQVIIEGIGLSVTNENMTNVEKTTA